METRSVPSGNRLPGCPLCGAAGRLWLHRDGRDLLRCARCGFAWVPQGVMRTASGKTIYDDDAPIFYSEAQADYYRDEVTVEAARAKVQWISRYVPSAGRVLDIGANFGHFVQQASERYEATGLEPSPTVVAWAREHLDVRLEVGSIERDIPDFHGRFDAITLFDVIEHLPDLGATLARCRTYLKRDGHLFISTPDLDSVMARILGRHWYYIDLVEHISLFGARNLRALLEKSGFGVKDVRTFGRRYRFSYIERRLRDLSASSVPLRVAAGLARPLAWFPSGRVWLNLRDVIGVAAQRAT